MIKDITITTPRLILRPPGAEDVHEINAALQPVWPELQKWMSWAHDGENALEATQRYIASIPALMEKGELPLLGFCRAGGQLVISTGLHYGNGICETGYWVTQEFLGKGYATEATNAVLRYAFYGRGLKAVGINYFEGNEKSHRVIEKLGFTPDGIRPKAQKRCLDGTPLDIHDFIMRDPSVLPDLAVTWDVAP